MRIVAKKKVNCIKDVGGDHDENASGGAGAGLEGPAGAGGDEEKRSDSQQVRRARKELSSDSHAGKKSISERWVSGWACDRIDA